MPCRCRDRRPWAWVSLPGPSTRVMLFPWPQFYNMSNGVSKSSSLKPSQIRSWITCVTPCLEAARVPVSATPLSTIGRLRIQAPSAT